MLPYHLQFMCTRRREHTTHNTNARTSAPREQRHEKNNMNSHKLHTRLDARSPHSLVSVRTTKHSYTLPCQGWERSERIRPVPRRERRACGFSERSIREKRRRRSRRRRRRRRLLIGNKADVWPSEGNAFGCVQRHHRVHLFSTM